MRALTHRLKQRNFRPANTSLALIESKDIWPRKKQSMYSKSMFWSTSIGGGKRMQNVLVEHNKINFDQNICFALLSHKYK